MTFKTFLRISLIIVFFACFPFIIFLISGESYAVFYGCLFTLPIGAVVLGVFWLVTLINWYLKKINFQ